MRGVRSSVTEEVTWSKNELNATLVHGNRARARNDIAFPIDTNQIEYILEVT